MQVVIVIIVALFLLVKCNQPSEEERKAQEASERSCIAGYAAAGTGRITDKIRNHCRGR